MKNAGVRGKRLAVNKTQRRGRIVVTKLRVNKGNGVGTAGRPRGFRS